MFDNINLNAAQGRKHIDLKEDDDVQYWTQFFGVPEGELQEAVRQVGDKSRMVASYLKRWKPSTPMVGLITATMMTALILVLKADRRQVRK